MKIKKYFIFCLIAISLLFSFSQYKNNEVFADMIKKSNDCIICLNNFDSVSDEYKKMFWDIKCPLTFQVNNTDDYSDYEKKFDKMLVNSLAIPKMYMSLVANGDGKSIRETLYNASEIAKNQGKCVVIIDMDKNDEEVVYYAIADSLPTLNKLNVNFVTMECIYKRVD